MPSSSLVLQSKCNSQLFSFRETQLGYGNVLKTRLLLIIKIAFLYVLYVLYILVSSNSPEYNQYISWPITAMQVVVGNPQIQHVKPCELCSTNHFEGKKLFIENVYCKKCCTWKIVICNNNKIFIWAFEYLTTKTGNKVKGKYNNNKVKDAT